MCLRHCKECAWLGTITSKSTTSFVIFLWAVSRSNGADALGVYDDVDDDVYAARLERWLKVPAWQGPGRTSE